MKDMKRFKELIGELHKMCSEEDAEVIDDKQQYARDDDQGEKSDGEDASTGGNFKVKSMAALMKKKMGVE